MKTNIMGNQKDRHINRLALLVTGAATLQMLESMIPYPLPGIKIGLANVFTVVALFQEGPAVTMEIAALRTIAGSLVLGTFLSPSFFLSFSGAAAGALLMSMIYTATIKRRHVLFSITGFSIMGAVANNVTQVLIAYLFCIRHSGILFMLPWLALAALPTGFLTGMISRKILLSLDMHNIKSAANHDIFEIPEKKNTDFIHAGIKKRFFLILIPILAVIILKNVILNVSMILLMLFILYISRISLKSSIGRMKHALLIICLSVLIPVFFNDSGQILLKIGPVAVTSDAISQSAIYLTRIITFMLGAHFLVQTSSKQELAGMIVRLLSPFKFFGIPFEKYSNIIIMSWISIPEFLNRINNSLSLSSKEKHKFREKINIFTDLIASFFVEQNENAPENSV